MIRLLLVLLATSISISATAQRLPMAGATWITDTLPENNPHPCPIFKKDMTIRYPLKQATLTLTAHGLYEAAVNGRRAGRALLTPGFTDYPHRLLYQTYDLTAQLRQGRNTLSVTVGDGWYRGPFGGALKRNTYGDKAAIIARLDLVYKDGRHETVTTDTTWECAVGSIRYSELYKGECIDHRERPHCWQNASAAGFPPGNLSESDAPPVTGHETFKARTIGKETNATLLDFGQNLAGWVRIIAKGFPGDTIKLKFAESLDRYGRLFRGNLRMAEAEDIFVCDGRGEETFEPHFTYHGFRYVEIETRAQLLDAKAIALYSDLEPTARFSCSDARLDRLMSNITWSAKSNFVGIPTDCPQRSERFGWTGDAEVFAPTAGYLMDVDAFFKGWLLDLASGQGVNGAVPSIIPDFRNPGQPSSKRGIAGWGDAATVIPWTLYRFYGDTQTLRAQYPSMKSWVDYISRESPGDLWTADGYGDWYAQGDSTSLPYIDQCYYYRSTRIVADAAKVLDDSADEKTYGRLAERIRAAFVRTFIKDRTQTSCILGLAFDLFPESQRRPEADSLVALIKRNNYHLATGFLGTPYLLPVLTRSGHTDIAYRLLEQTTCPSWLYPLTKGATTIWEKWDAIRPDGGFDTSSLNHYAYGAVGQWMFETIGGIKPLAPGFKTFAVEPEPGGGLRWANVDYRTSTGWIRVHWRKEGDTMTLSVTVPRGKMARIKLANGKTVWKGPGGYRFTLPPTARQ